MSKYAPLALYLETQRADRVSMRFEDVQGVLGFDLPKSSRLYNAWWSNSDTSHTQAQAWLSAGFQTANVNLAAKTVDFVRPTSGAGQARGFGEMLQDSFAAKDEPQGEIADEEKKPHPLFGIWKGLVTLDPDYDYTQPADPDWGKVYDD